ncbi:hypothetical protein C8R44DRAFT_851161 [Mycena epipterygia]|nr:hypothetical protein C8R44DRAFT_851161 [Mycena epipterygia]
MTTDSLRAHLLQISAEMSLIAEDSEANTVRCLKDEQQSIQNTLDSIVYPILTIPAELTTEIFVHCLPDGPSDPSPSVAPMLLGTICRQWREIAWNTPALWDSLTIEWRYHETRDLKSLAELWSSRHGRRTANTLRMHCVHPWSNDQFETLMLDAIPRWLNLELAMQADIAGKCFRTVQSLPLLQTLDIRLLDLIDIEDRLFVFSNAPALHTAHLHGYIPPSLFILPWHQLTDFLGENYTVDECLDVLRQSPCLIKCSFIRVEFITNAGDPAPVATSIPLPPNPFLQSLTLSNGVNNTDDLCQQVHVLNFLTAPALQQLDLDYITVHTPLIQFLSNHPLLRKIRLSLAELESSIFQHLPGLVSLDLRAYDGDGDASSRFFYMVAYQHLPPQSNHLRHHVERKPVDYALLADALASRWESRSGVAKLQHLYFCRKKGSTPDLLILDRMSDLIQQGMSIQLRVQNWSWP